MPDRPTAPNGNTSLALILLSLIVGIALGWLLHDMFRGAAMVAPPSAPPTTDNRRPTGAPQPTAALVPTIGSAPTALPVPAQPTVSILEPTIAATAAIAVPPVPSPLPTAAPTPQIVAYAGHIVAEGETLESIAAAGGSTPDLLAAYNVLNDAPQPGRALIVPQLAGQPSTLENAAILVQRGRAERPWVALTLDAGASAEPVPSMLKTLRERGVQITFFLTGKWIKDNPELAQQIVADGHEIANHTFSHPDLRNLDDVSIRKELADTEALLQETSGATSRPFFRPPFGAYDERVLKIVEAEGYLPIYWTLDSLDSVGEPKTPAFLLERITAKLSPEQLRGAIILAHCGSAPTAEALPHILDRFTEMGFEVKKVSEVLGS